MFEFFITLFGGLYYGCKFAAEHAGEKLWQREQAKKSDTYRNFLNSVCDYRIVREVMEKVDDPAFAELVEGETRDVLLSLPPIDPCLVRKDDARMEKIDIMLAKSGHLRDVCVVYHPNDQKWERKNQLAEWICGELNRHGLDLAIVPFQKDISRYHFEPRSCQSSKK